MAGTASQRTRTDILIGRGPRGLPCRCRRLLFLLLLRLGNRRDELGAATRIQNLLSWLPRSIQFPVPCGMLIGRIQNRMVEEGIRHGDGLRVSAWLLFSGSLALSNKYLATAVDYASLMIFSDASLASNDDYCPAALRFFSGWRRLTSADFARPVFLKSEGEAD